MSIIENTLAFIVAIGILVTVHEFGHYWVARRLGVKILRFSVGFGYPLWSRCFGKDKTEFVLAAIPLGGYVKMLDEREGEVAPEEAHRAFNRQPLKVRSAIVFAGPLFNFIFAIFAYAMMYMVGVTGMKAFVGDVEPQSVAERAGFQSGYQIIAVNEKPTLHWDNIIQTTLEQLLNENNTVTYSIRTEQDRHYDLKANLTGFTVDDIAGGNFFEKLGFKPYRPPPPATIGKIMPDSPAQKAGLKNGDKVIAMDSQQVTDWYSWAKYVKQRPNQKINVEVERNQQRLHLTLTPMEFEGKGRVGVYSPDSYIIPEKYQGIERYGLGQALIEGTKKTWEISILSLRVMVKMLTLQVSYEHISGPITIAEFAGKTAQIGLSAFLSFLGLVSVSLGIINLLPIPLLDGGHLFFYLIEFIKRSPVSENTEYFLQRIGLTLLLCLMGLAIFNDLERLFN
ncbi:RIP metalloprotease RseP [Candidatus Halobeggiatoa sp. HSG11]|nr:RIP metalloprotease RseP [Candidatus Halobeggiatoa sp. HSG11]